MKSNRLARIKSWLHKNIFWILAITVFELGILSISEDNVLAAFAFLLLFGVVLGFGVYYHNLEFTREVLNDYERTVKIQKARKFKILPGGKKP